uniref:Fasciclin-like arabinogalactan protein 19 n=2 Tax=Cajanus cajan TaxID=3821 RepID=A0A151T7Z9_CAJCA|nr:Fasciclin-like arabinogalactan protein 19 [Cajanus cajan]
MMMMVVLLGNGVSVSCIPRRELDSMLDTVRARGYDLFCNAIVTSDLQIQLADNNNNSHSFTFFAPTDASLFALDMTQTASSYTDTLRLHVVPRRLSLTHLRLLPDGYTLPTLLPRRRLQLTRRSPSAIVVGGVHVASPGLFYGRNIAVHGLAGILSLRSNNSPSPSPIRSFDNRFFSPRSSPNSPANEPVLAPFSIMKQAGSPTPAAVEAPKEEPGWTVYPPSERYPESSISLPPEGYSDAEAPAPEGVRKCLNRDVGLEESVMQCYEA